MELGTEVYVMGCPHEFNKNSALMRAFDHSIKVTVVVEMGSDCKSHSNPCGGVGTY
jgi:hypothetical protein